jgi:hypothetical protein
MSENRTSEPVARVRNRFEFNIQAPLKTAAPLFGPEGERVWADDQWDPKFVFPTPACDTEGAVFTVARDNRKSTWVNTVFDLDGGRMQYVYFIPNALVTLIDIRLKAFGEDRTHVSVVYQRTALDPEANEQVRQMGVHDGSSGPEWERSIEQYLKGSASKGV